MGTRRVDGVARPYRVACDLRMISGWILSGWDSSGGPVAEAAQRPRRRRLDHDLDGRRVRVDDASAAAARRPLQQRRRRQRAGDASPRLVRLFCDASRRWRASAMAKLTPRSGKS